jgi:hypothetical protein
VLADGFVDLDADGLPDVVTHYNTSDEPDSCSEDSGVEVCPAWAWISRARSSSTFTRRRLVYSSDVNDISGVTGGDVNGDWRPDLVVAFSSYVGYNGVDLRFGVGNGRFARRLRFRSTVQPPVAVTFADVNRDGRPDLVTANNGDSDSNRLRAGSVSVFLASSHGLGRRRNYRIGGGADGLVVTDLNGDGAPDVAVSRGEAGRFISVLLNRGDGTLRPKRDYRGARRAAIGLAAGDLNGDGLVDLVTTNWPRGVAILLNRGGGTFGPRHVFVPHRRAFSVAVGDVNGDGRLDVLTQAGYAAPRPPLLVLLNSS